MIKKEPISFHPYLKTVIWGGNKICRYKGITQTEPNIGESWEISEVPGYESIVSEGEYKGWNLTQLIREFGEELLGKRVMEKYKGNFPLLVKIIDANDNLSVQVHPNDKLAKERHNCLGKTEMWYIIDSENDAKIFSGLNRPLAPQDYIEHIKKGDFDSLLKVHDSRSGDVFFLPAGRVHAIGAGNLLAEIQESSDITYRIYDYNRKDANGNTRELHTELAKDAIDFTYQENYKNPPLPEDNENCHLVSCEHFTTKRLKISGEMKLNLDYDSFTVLMCVKGMADLDYQNGNFQIKEGHSVLLPAVMNELTIKGKATILSTHS